MTKQRKKWYNTIVRKNTEPGVTYMQLDYSLTTPEERIECVNKLLSQTPDEKLTPQYLL